MMASDAPTSARRLIDSRRTPTFFRWRVMALEVVKPRRASSSNFPISCFSAPGMPRSQSCQPTPSKLMAKIGRTPRSSRASSRRSLTRAPFVAICVTVMSCLHSSSTRVRKSSRTSGSPPVSVTAWIPTSAISRMMRRHSAVGSSPKRASGAERKQWRQR